MSHIPSSAMPHAHVHHDPDTDAPKPKKDKHRTGPDTGQIAALALGGLVVVGALAATILPLVLKPAEKPKKAKSKKKSAV